MAVKIHTAPLVLALLLAALLCACGETESAPSSGGEGAPEDALVDTFYPEWSSDEIYHAGDIVIHNGKYFRALWWTQGREPLEDVERDEWACLGSVPVQGSAYFNDVSSTAWYAEAINTLAAGGVLSTEEKSFYPSRPISRGQFAVLLCRALEIAPVEDGDNFADAGDTWYTPYLAALKQNGFASGGAQNNFAPERSLTRQELCTLIYNACGGFAEDPMTTFAPYSDSGDVASWAVQPMSWCIERGILETSGRNLLPEETVSRAQAAQSIYNLLYGSAALS